MTLDNTTMYMVQTNANGYIVAFENQWMTKAGIGTINGSTS